MDSTVLNIFYTDDDPDDQDMFKDAAYEISSSLRITTQCNGDELIDQLQNPPPFPSIIFLDLNMPMKDGYEVLKEINQLKHDRSFPVVIFSTSSDEKAINTTRQLGADLFITKPSSYSSLKEVIRHIVSINWENYSNSDDNYVYRIN